MASAEAIVVPDDVSHEKVKALEALGANVEIVRPASIVDKKQVSPRASPTDCPRSIVSYFFPAVRGEYTVVDRQGKDC